jgi:hypothetical protein
MIGAAARGGFTVIRFMVLHLPDRAMAFLARAAVKLGYIVTGDEAMMNAGAEIVDIFESGPPFTPTIRKLMRAAEPEVVVSAVKCQARPSPYGAKP